MMLHIGRLFTARAAALARQFHARSVPPLVQARDLRAMVALPSHGGGTLEDLPGYKKEAMVWTKPEPHGASVWVRARDRNYRDAFRTFISSVYGDNIDWGDFGHYDVDHVYNKANALPDDWLRIEGIARGINRSHGASFERVNTESTIEISNRGDTEQSLMHFVMLLKVAGLAPPKSMDDVQRLAPAATYFQSNGWDRSEVMMSIESLIRKSRWRR